MAGLVDAPVTIKDIEYSTVDPAWDDGLISPHIHKERTGMTEITRDIGSIVPDGA